MKKYQDPTLEVEALEIRDVISTSGGTDCDDDLGLA